MATISFLAGENFDIAATHGSGQGQYGPGGFGTSVRVGEYPDNTYLTDFTGSTQGAKVDNVKYVHPNSGEIAGGTVLALRSIPNYLSTLCIQFSHATPVKVNNAVLRAYDRVNLDSPPSGVTVKAFEHVHPWTATTPLGSGGTTWSTLGGSGGLINGVNYDPPLQLAESPGLSGLSPNGSNTSSTTHNWYVSVSTSPDSLGAKQSALWVTLEYL